MKTSAHDVKPLSATSHTAAATALANASHHVAAQREYRSVPPPRRQMPRIPNTAISPGGMMTSDVKMMTGRKISASVPSASSNHAAMSKGVEPGVTSLT